MDATELRKRFAAEVADLHDRLDKLDAPPPPATRGADVVEGLMRSIATLAPEARALLFSKAAQTFGSGA